MLQRVTINPRRPARQQVFPIRAEHSAVAVSCVSHRKVIAECDTAAGDGLWVFHITRSGGVQERRVIDLCDGPRSSRGHVGALKLRGVESLRVLFDAAS